MVYVRTLIIFTGQHNLQRIAYEKQRSYLISKHEEMTQKYAG